MERTKSPLTRPVLLFAAISCPTVSDCYAAGYNQVSAVIVATTDGGKLGIRATASESKYLDG